MNGYDICNQDMNNWIKVFQEWILKIETYCERTLDSIYTHGERANVALLLSSAWISNCVGSMEIPFYPNEGGRLDIDLWIQFPSSQGDKKELIEAKFDWFENLSKEKTIEKANNKLNETYHDVSKKYSYGGRPLGIVFCCPTFTKTTLDELKVNIQDSLQAFREVQKDAMAYCFPRKQLTIDGEHYRNIICPGVVALLKEFSE